MTRVAGSARWLLTGRGGRRPDLGRPWKVWDLDAELRYQPVVDALPESELPICEVGSGPAGLAAWTRRPVIGVDPGEDARHGVDSPPTNMKRVFAAGAELPLPDRSVCAAVAVDTFEHIPRAERGQVLEEMKRVTAPGGRLLIIGPCGEAAAAADRRLLARWESVAPSGNIAAWLREHVEQGLPSVEELVGLIGSERVASIRTTGAFNIHLWWTMHRVTLGDFPQPRGTHLIHHLLWSPLAVLARTTKRGPHYRQLIVADLTEEERPLSAS